MVYRLEFSPRQRVEDIAQIGPAGDEIETSSRPQDALRFLNPGEGEFLVALAGNFDVAIHYQVFVPVVMPVQLIALDAIGRVGDDQVDASIGKIGPGGGHAIPFAPIPAGFRKHHRPRDRGGQFSHRRLVVRKDRIE
jgi:hypothetical protein